MTAHKHCDSCFKINCDVKSDGEQSCNMIYCLNGCGLRYHSCKSQEHKLVCSREKVPCINRVNGCPVVMARGRLSRHLPQCPASLVCTREWNRWPMHSQDKGWKAPMPFKNPHVKCGQLDVAFALRDQKMLMESFKTPKKTRRALRNPFTQCYPAVPIQSHSSALDSPTSETSLLSDDESGTPWDLHQSPPGLQQTILKQLSPAPNHTQSGSLYAASREATESLTKALDYVTGIQGLKRLSELSKAKQAKVDALNESQDAVNSADLMTEQLKSSNLHEARNQNDFKAYSHNDEMSVSTHSVEDNTVNSSEDDMIDIYSTEKKLFEVLGLDLTMHFICSYQAKPLKMFTFLCGCEFRRDEYQCHVRNLHVDIQCNLNCWFEQRCPLAYLGCTFAFQRFKPKNAVLTHSPILNTFGVSDIEEFEKDFEHLNGKLTDDEDISTVMGRKRLREATPEIHTSYKCDSAIKVIPRYKSVSRESSPVKYFSPIDEYQHSLTDLPFMVLQNIARNLDGFSLQHLSMTCKLLQSVCCSLLDEKGIVSLVWEKNKDPQAKPVWNVSHKVKHSLYLCKIQIFI